ncbi:MAG: hypothetical protein WA919_14685 [Coleofasciculaceae cyanobacterium]
MFFDELAPVFKEFTQQPIAFFGGFFSGALRLNLADDPVKSWLDEQIGSTSNTTVTVNSKNGNSQGPQSISID